ncbi:hypothetical protein RN001_013350 [Aquatica leii]|uniref:Protein sleepless n=1 Tax=Aquatica leii TaxID=1421715 RepID=A0AAN7SNP7_9COLE|nr:hypothetical protein RN001_013350 [Aquatica leii]
MEKLLIALACLALLHTGSAMKCYNCQSTTNDDCKDYTKIQTVDCNPTRDALSPVCIKRVLQSASGTNITLQCLYKQNGNECDPPSVQYNVTNCIMCHDDFCNTSSTTYSNLFIILSFQFGLMCLLK